jgi:hypothetical protein
MKYWKLAALIMVMVGCGNAEVTLQQGRSFYITCVDAFERHVGDGIAICGNSAIAESCEASELENSTRFIPFEGEGVSVAPLKPSTDRINVVDAEGNIIEECNLHIDGINVGKASPYTHGSNALGHVIEWCDPRYDPTCPVTRWFKKLNDGGAIVADLEEPQDEVIEDDDAPEEPELTDPNCMDLAAFEYVKHDDDRHVSIISGIHQEGEDPDGVENWRTLEEDEYTYCVSDDKSVTFNLDLGGDKYGDHLFTTPGESIVDDTDGRKVLFTFEGCDEVWNILIEEFLVEKADGWYNFSFNPKPSECRIETLDGDEVDPE